MATTFGGDTFLPDRDGQRLMTELRLVEAALADGEWWTLAELAQRVGKPEASVSARLRDLRKPKFGGRRVERRYVGGGVFGYRLR